LSNDANRIDWRTVDSFEGNFTSEALMAMRPCPVCEGLVAPCVMELSAFQFYSDSRELPKRATVRTVQCARCFALFQNPCFTPFGFRVLAAEAGRSYGSTEGRAAEQIEWLARHGRLEAGSCVVDIGCFEGSFLGELPPSLHRVGVDIDAPAIERGRLKYGPQGISFVLGDFETFAYDERAPDTITMLMVLEHLPRPVEVLRKLRSLAHAGTRLVIEVPILERGPTDDVNGFFSVLHTTHFSRTTLDRALRRAGWSVVAATDQEDYNGYRVLAAPSGPSESVKPNVRDLVATHEALARWHRAAGEVDAKIAEARPADHWVVWGAGGHTEFLYHNTTLFRGASERRFGLVDSDLLKHGKTWRGLVVQAPSTLALVDWRNTNLVVSSYGGQESIARAARALGVPEDRIVRLYDEVRVC
jgi:ubiquinone/menaquinone biosynthesis C-methylase UbiE